LSKQRGGIMVITLVVLTAVAAIMSIGFARYRVEVRASITRNESRRARIMAEAGIARAISALQAQNTTLVAQTDDWYLLGNAGSDAFLVGKDKFSVQILDAASLVNLNTASEEQLQALNLTTEQIDGLLDWREEGTSPRTDGAKDEFYNSLENPYNAHLARLTTLDELLLIKGFTPTSLFEVPEQTSTNGIEPQPLAQLATVDSFSPNLTSAGAPKTNINTASQQQLTQAGLTPQVAAAILVRRAGGFATFGDVLRVPGIDNRAAGILVDNFALGGAPRFEGRINVNTATEAVLATIPGITSDVAQAIYGRQSTGLTALSELLQVPGYTLQVMQQSIDRLTISSETFIVRTEGTAGSTTVSLEAIISLNGGRPHVIKTYEPPYSTMRTFWQWSDATTSETVITEAP
jgi:general secretion pathway protein K